MIKFCLMMLLIYVFCLILDAIDAEQNVRVKAEYLLTLFVVLIIMIIFP